MLYMPFFRRYINYYVRGLLRTLILHFFDFLVQLSNFFSLVLVAPLHIFDKIMVFISIVLGNIAFFFLCTLDIEVDVFEILELLLVEIFIKLCRIVVELHIKMLVFWKTFYCLLIYFVIFIIKIV